MRCILALSLLLTSIFSLGHLVKLNQNVELLFSNSNTIIVTKRLIYNKKKVKRTMNIDSFRQVKCYLSYLRVKTISQLFKNRTRLFKVAALNTKGKMVRGTLTQEESL